MEADKNMELAQRINDLEVMVASLSSQLAQLKNCEHSWQPVTGPAWIFNRVGALAHECSKCGMRYNSYEDCEAFN